MPFEFIRSVRGNMSITTALVGLMLATAAGAAFDTGRQATTSQKLQSITDGAALAAMAEPGMSNSQRQSLAIRAVRDMATESGLTADDLNIDAQIRNDGSQVYVSLAADVPMLFGALMGADTRRVSVDSLAEEFAGSTATPISMSVVLDLSSSMNERFDTGSKIASVKTAISGMLGQHGGSVASSGVYGFNWGAVANETAPLSAGSNHVIDTLAYLSLGEGSVPTTSMEVALNDQIKDMKRGSAANRYIIYITDGAVDNERSDKRGRYLADHEMLSDESEPECPAALDELKKAREKLAQHYNNISRNADGGGLLGFVTDTAEDLLDDVNRLIGLHNQDPNSVPDANGVQRMNNWVRKYDEALNEVDEYCVFEQTRRVLNVCERAPVDADVGMVAVNLSGEDGEAERVTQSCLRHASGTTRAGRQGSDILPDFDALPTKRLANGLEVTVSEDGKSMYAAVETLDDLRHVLSSLLPNQTYRRTVRLVK